MENAFYFPKNAFLVTKILTFLYFLLFLVQGVKILRDAENGTVMMLGNGSCKFLVVIFKGI